MTRYLVLRIDHATAPGESDAAARRIAAILGRPCLAVLERLAIYRGARTDPFAPSSAAAIEAGLVDPGSLGVKLYSDHGAAITAAAYVPSGRHVARHGRNPHPAPLCTHVIVRHEPRDTEPHLAAFWDLAMALGAISGCVSVEPDFQLAQRVAFGCRPPLPFERALAQAGMSAQRFRERRAHNLYGKHIDCRIAGPEWGTILSRGHLRVLPASTLEASRAFFRVRRLGPELVFLQLTPDPADSVRPDYDRMLDPARQALAPILMDLTGVPA